MEVGLYLEIPTFRSWSESAAGIPVAERAGSVACGCASRGVPKDHLEDWAVVCTLSINPTEVNSGILLGQQWNMFA